VRPVEHLVEPVALRHPFWRVFGRLRERPYAFLLDSAAEAGGLGRCSFMGADPLLVFDAWRLRGDPQRRAAIRVARFGGAGRRPRLSSWVGDPFAELQRLLRELRVAPEALAGRPVPFLAGGVGWFGYEAGTLLEDVPDTGRDDLRQPDVHVAVFDAVLAHDHATGASYLSVLGRGDDRRAARRRALALRDARLRELREADAALADEPAPSFAAPEAAPPEVTAHVDPASYARAVEACREHIARGDAFEICLTHRLEAPFPGDPWSLYQALRAINPAPFAAYLRAPGAHVLSASPERFLRLDAGGVVESRPIKGTRPRGATPEQDAALRDELRTSPKDRAENMMIVDLVRNDLGRVCEIGSVEVPELMVVEPYATVHQLVSTIRGRLRDDADAIDLVRAAFPGGSMTGAPKIEAMKIIDRLEPDTRGIYSGALGYLDLAGGLDLSIVIRTLVVQDGRCSFGVGGAVVADSDPEEEHREALDKARALKLALGLAAAAEGARR
jgi:aminodeoxychorismate synthase component I